MIDAWLRKKVADGLLISATWVAEANAINPWDFEIEELDGTKARVEVKSTTGPFERPFHISQAEVEAASSETVRTDIYRVYAVSGDGAWLQMANGVSHFAKGILTVVNGLESGIVPDGYSARPESFGSWSEPLRIGIDTADDE
jgi:Domain of unknown function (DUF3883)